MNKGLFIVFEGLDGSGTSTQANLLLSSLNKLGLQSHLTSEPSSGPIGTFIRQSFKGRVNLSKGISPVTGNDLFDEQMAYLFAADRHDHLFNQVDGVFKLVKESRIVVSTRYFFSSLAYHTHNEYDMARVKDLNKAFPNPDLVVYFKGNVDVSLNRMESRAFKDEYENREKLELVYKNYEKIFKEYKGKLLTVNALNSVEEIHNEILEFVLEMIGN
ncbi:dTMP kinase [Pseudoalteromonas distincta]|uniref:dTMP kinase n=1 Tax=Pseudoalteromonas distincta TaxID=77608 RepID=UPI0032189685